MKHSTRHLENWVDSYLELMEGTEPAKQFDLWTSLSVIAAALRRKVILQLGRLTYHTNIYVVLVAEPGVARKTQAIKNGVKFLETIPDIHTSADSITKEAMTDDMNEAGGDELLSNGDTFHHCSLNIISKEFESFLGQKKENNKMLTALTDLFDCPDTFAARTRSSKSVAISYAWLNLLAATTPDSLASSLPATAVGGGLTSRIMFIWADKKKRNVAIPVMTDKDIKLKEALEKDLYQISRIRGEYGMPNDCMKKWVDWYNAYDEDESGNRICTDKSFSGWYSRKPTYILKIAMLCAAAESNELLLQWRHIEKAMGYIKDVEMSMGNAFKAIGKSEISAEVGTVLSIIRSYGVIEEKQLMSIVWRDIDSSKFDNVIDTLRKTGKIDRFFKGPNGEKGIWYKSME